MKNNCARECSSKYFHTFKLRCVYAIDLTKGDFITGINFDEKLKQFVQENGSIHKLTIKFSHINDI